MSDEKNRVPEEETQAAEACAESVHPEGATVESVPEERASVTEAPVSVDQAPSAQDSSAEAPSDAAEGETTSEGASAEASEEESAPLPTEEDTPAAEHDPEVVNSEDESSEESSSEESSADEDVQDLPVEEPSEKSSAPPPPPEDAPSEPGTSSAEAPPVEKKKKKGGYLKYSPISLLMLAACAFVFSFSLLGIFEQSLLDTAVEGVRQELSGLAFPELQEGDSSVMPPLPYPDLDAWQAIAPTDIDPATLPFLQTVDFAALKGENEDTVCWLYVPSTADVKGLPINLPVVQGDDNDYYLNTSFDHSVSENGWVYADCRNYMPNLRSNRNLIFYGHARSYMIFGGLKYLNTQRAWQQDGYNHFIYINTPMERSVWQIFSWYETTVDFNYIDTAFVDDAEYVDFLYTLQNKNMIPAFEKFEFSPKDRIMTMSTCKGTDENMRVAVHAVLVKHEALGELPGPSFTDDDGQGFTGSSGGSGVTDNSTDVTDGSVDAPTDIPTDIPTDTPTDIPSTDGTGASPDVGTTDVPPSTDVPGTDSSVDTSGQPTDVPTDSVGADPSDTTDSGGTTEGGGEIVSSDSASVPTDNPGVTDSGTPTDDTADSGTSVPSESSSEVPQVPSDTDGGTASDTSLPVDSGTPTDLPPA